MFDAPSPSQRFGRGMGRTGDYGMSSFGGEEFGGGYGMSSFGREEFAGGYESSLLAGYGRGGDFAPRPLMSGREAPWPTSRMSSRSFMDLGGSPYSSFPDSQYPDLHFSDAHYGAGGGHPGSSFMHPRQRPLMAPPAGPPGYGPSVYGPSPYDPSPYGPLSEPPIGQMYPSPHPDMYDPSPLMPPMSARRAFAVAATTKGKKARGASSSKKTLLPRQPLMSSRPVLRHPGGFPSMDHMDPMMGHMDPMMHHPGAMMRRRNTFDFQVAPLNRGRTNTLAARARLQASTLRRRGARGATKGSLKETAKAAVRAAKTGPKKSEAYHKKRDEKRKAYRDRMFVWRKLLYANYFFLPFEPRKNVEAAENEEKKSDEDKSGEKLGEMEAKKVEDEVLEDVESEDQAAEAKKDAETEAKEGKTETETNGDAKSSEEDAAEDTEETDSEAANSAAIPNKGVAKRGRGKGRGVKK